MENKSKIIAIIACALAVCLLLGVVISAAVASTPKNSIENAVEKSFKAATKSDDAKFIEDVLNGGSIEISANLGEIMEGMGAEEGVDLDLSAKLYFDLSALATAFQLAASMDGDALIDALAYISGEQIAISSEALLGEEAYGIIFKDIEKNFDDSIFGEDGAYALPFTYEDIAAVMSALETAEKPPKEIEKFIDKTEKMVDKIYEKIFKTVVKHAETDKANGTISCAGKDVKTKDVTFVLNGESVSLIVTDLYEYLKEDKALKSYLTEDVPAVIPVLSEYVASMPMFGVASETPAEPSWDVEEGDEAPETEEEDEGSAEMDPEEIADELKEQVETAVEEFYDALDEVDIDDITEDIADAADDFEATLIIHISKKNSQVIGLDAKAEYDGNDIIDVSVVCGPDWDEITELSVKAEVQGQKVIDVAYEVSENTKKLYTAEIKVKEGSETVAKVSIDWDKKEGTLKVKVKSGDMEVGEFKGNLKTSSKEIVLVLEKITVGENEVKLGDVTVTVKKGDKMPKPGKVTDILTLSEDDFTELGESITENAQKLVEDLGDKLEGFGDLFGGSAFPDVDIDPDYGYDEEPLPEDYWR